MSRGYEPSKLNMKEVQRVMTELEKENKCFLTIELYNSTRKETDGKLIITCAAYKTKPDAGGKVSYQASLPWPTDSHQTVLGAMYWLLIDVGSQLAAGSALEGMGA